MKNLITTILLIFLISCKKEPEKQQIASSKEYIFDYNKEKIDENDDTEPFLNIESYDIDRYIQTISKDEYIKDSLNYKNSLDSQKYKFTNNILETAYGNVKFIPSQNKNVDSEVNFSYSGFAEPIDSHIINLNLYEGEKALILNNKDYKYYSISALPFFSESKKYALNFKDNDGLSSQVSVYNIENKKLKHLTTLWSENYISDNVIWDDKDNIILKLREIDTGINIYAKIAVADLKSQNKTISKVNLSEANQDWKGNYQITTKAISNYNKKEIDLLYNIAITSETSATLSIGADQVQDYWCEGEYTLTNSQGILLAKGKCDEDDIDDFYLKQENGKYFIKSKRFLNQDWQELRKK